MEEENGIYLLPNAVLHPDIPEEILEGFVQFKGLTGEMLQRAMKTDPLIKNGIEYPTAVHYLASWVEAHDAGAIYGGNFRVDGREIPTVNRKVRVLPHTNKGMVGIVRYMDSSGFGEREGTAILLFNQDREHLLYAVIDAQPTARTTDDNGFIIEQYINAGGLNRTQGWLRGKIVGKPLPGPLVLYGFNRIPPTDSGTRMRVALPDSLAA